MLQKVPITNSKTLLSNSLMSGLTADESTVEAQFLALFAQMLWMQFHFLTNIEVGILLKRALHNVQNTHTATHKSSQFQHFNFRVQES